MSRMDTKNEKMRPRPIEGGRAAPIVRSTLHDEITARVRDMIVEGQIEAGSRINEVHLGRDLGVSRTPLREALKTLASEELVELIPNRGAYVKIFAVQEIEDMLEALRYIEQSCAALACERASNKQISEFEKLHKAMIRDYNQKDIINYFKINQKIHEMIVEISGNKTLSWVHKTIHARLRRIRFLGVDAPAVWAAAIAHHEAMMSALKARDAKILVAIVGEHMDLTISRIRSTGRGAYL